MSQVVRSPRDNPLIPPSPERVTASLCSIVYRSHAVSPLSGYELYELVRAAQARNRLESVTGLMLYDKGRFYQWLEGPRASVSAIMNSILNDRRHVDIEVLSDKPLATRQFSQWTMRLASRGVRSVHSGHDVTVLSKATFEELLQHPDQVPAILAAVASVKPVVEPPPSVPARGGPGTGNLRGEAGAMLKNVILTTVIPEVLARHAIGGGSALWPIDTRSRALADLLSRPDTGAALELVRTLLGSRPIQQLYKTLLEPAARRLGDLWSDDVCSEFDVTLGLSQLQRVIRVLGEDVAPVMSGIAITPAVLIVPEPGESHSLTASLNSDSLWQAGWDTQSEYPSTDEALQDLVADSWFDAMDLSLSAAFRREHWLPRVTRTIALARHASRNRAMVVVVGGRVFAEDSGATAQVGADGATSTSLDAETVIRASLLPGHLAKRMVGR